MKFKFSHMMLVIALAVAGCAGYFSVWGLSQLFAGASTAVIIMASILEIGKVITTTALHRYWTKLAKGLKIYLTISVGVLMLITSAGIYGFLSNAYQKTANKLEIHEGEMGVLLAKKESFNKNILDNEKNIQFKNKRIDQLTNLRINQESRLDSAKSNKNKDKVRNDISLATTEIQKLTNDIDNTNAKITVLSDSVAKYDIRILTLKSGNEVAAEVGPLKYISELTNIPMNKVVNYLILLLIFVFDPLAIALILMTNRVFQLENSLDEPIIIKEKNEGTIEGTIEGVNDVESDVESVVVNDVVNTPEPELYIPVQDIDESFQKSQVTEDLVPKSPVMEDSESKKVSEAKIEVPIYKKEPVITTGKIEVQDIKEVKENRGFSTPIPTKDNNTIERIGSNKVIKNGDNNKFFFKRK